LTSGDVLDTNVISEVFRPRPDARALAWLESLTAEGAITAITLAQLPAGVSRLPDGRRKSALSTRIDAALQPYRETRAVLAFDDEAAAQYADVLVEREAARLPIRMADAQTAAICRAHHATCVTRNIKDFTGTAIELIDPWTE